jgi:hypothetical protein
MGIARSYIANPMATNCRVLNTGVSRERVVRFGLTAEGIEALEVTEFARLSCVPPRNAADPSLGHSRKDRRCSPCRIALSKRSGVGRENRLNGRGV